MELHNLTEEALPLIKERAMKSFRKKISSVIPLPDNERILMPGGDLADWCCMTITRMLLRKTIRFQGIPFDSEFIQRMGDSVRRDTLKKIPQELLFIEEAEAILRYILHLYHRRQHIVVFDRKIQYQRRHRPFMHGIQAPTPTTSTSYH